MLFRSVAAHTALLCNWCADLGHFTHNCQDAHEWINAGRVIHGTDGRLYMPDSSNILHAPGGRCLRDSVEYAMSLQQSGQQLAQQPAQHSAKQSTQQLATISTSASSGFTRDPLPHLTAGLLCSAFPEMPTILDVDPSAFLTMAVSTTDYPPMPIVKDIDFQPYIAQAWVAFQADRVLKDKNKKCLHFDDVKISPHKTPLDKALNLESCRATVSEEMEVLSPELQRVAKATPALVPVVASDQPSRLNARTSPALLPSAPVSAPAPALTSTGQSRQSSAQSGSTGTIPPCVLPANQPLVPTTQYWYSFPMEDKTAPRRVLDWVLGSNVPIPVKDLLIVAPEFRKQLCELITVKCVTTNPSSHVVQVNELSGCNPLAVAQEYSNRVIKNDDGLIVTHHSLPLHTLEAKIPGTCCSLMGVLDSRSEVVVMPKHIWEELRLPLHSNHVLQMTSANTSIDSTMGVLENLALDFGAGEVLLQVQIMWCANFDLLLG